jgi:hypothetical protein
LHFAENGADIVIKDLDESQGKKTAEEIMALGTGSMLVQARVGNISAAFPACDRAYLDET